ncbi:hypothetical protein BESB_060590 [Besnoitia besnoiti]|uniref:non-specific serine/threonine protein kinase n=1 Tax=Besnoitia besnoiti TaxID=94643 RepID=A0A2A9MIF2_BESBE|nr:hypothetical protein BESB_060590 [Besnoitia besnoiti]PFH35172.1 hypothetical protein BESB_060590 [Besnoitia besnoiti]
MQSEDSRRKTADLQHRNWPHWEVHSALPAAHDDPLASSASPAFLSSELRETHGAPAARSTGVPAQAPLSVHAGPSGAAILPLSDAPSASGPPPAAQMPTEGQVLRSVPQPTVTSFPARTGDPGFVSEAPAGLTLGRGVSGFRDLHGRHALTEHKGTLTLPSAALPPAFAGDSSSDLCTPLQFSPGRRAVSAQHSETTNQGMAQPGPHTALLPHMPYPQNLYCVGAQSLSHFVPQRCLSRALMSPFSPEATHANTQQAFRHAHFPPLPPHCAFRNAASGAVAADRPAEPASVATPQPQRGPRAPTGAREGQLVFASEAGGAQECFPSRPEAALGQGMALQLLPVTPPARDSLAPDGYAFAWVYEPSERDNALGSTLGEAKRPRSRQPAHVEPPADGSKPVETRLRPENPSRSGVGGKEMHLSSEKNPGNPERGDAYAPHAETGVYSGSSSDHSEARPQSRHPGGDLGAPTAAADPSLALPWGFTGFTCPTGAALQGGAGFEAGDAKRRAFFQHAFEAAEAHAYFDGFLSTSSYASQSTAPPDSRRFLPVYAEGLTPSPWATLSAPGPRGPWSPDPTPAGAQPRAAGLLAAVGGDGAGEACARPPRCLSPACPPPPGAASAPSPWFVSAAADWPALGLGDPQASGRVETQHAVHTAEGTRRRHEGAVTSSRPHPCERFTEAAREAPAESLLEVFRDEVCGALLLAGKETARDPGCVPGRQLDGARAERRGKSGEMRVERTESFASVESLHTAHAAETAHSEESDLAGSAAAAPAEAPQERESRGKESGKVDSSATLEGSESVDCRAAAPAATPSPADAIREEGSDELGGAGAQPNERSHSHGQQSSLQAPPLPPQSLAAMERRPQARQERALGAYATSSFSSQDFSSPPTLSPHAAAGSPPARREENHGRERLHAHTPAGREGLGHSKAWRPPHVAPSSPLVPSSPQVPCSPSLFAASPAGISKRNFSLSRGGCPAPAAVPAGAQAFLTGGLGPQEGKGRLLERVAGAPGGNVHIPLPPRTLFPSLPAVSAGLVVAGDGSVAPHPGGVPTCRPPAEFTGASRDPRGDREEPALVYWALPPPRVHLVPVGRPAKPPPLSPTAAGAPATGRSRPRRYSASVFFVPEPSPLQAAHLSPVCSLVDGMQPPSSPQSTLALLSPRYTQTDVSLGRSPAPLLSPAASLPSRVTPNSPFAATPPPPLRRHASGQSPHGESLSRRDLSAGVRAPPPLPPASPRVSRLAAPEAGRSRSRDSAERPQDYQEASRKASLSVSLARPLSSASSLFRGKQPEGDKEKKPDPQAAHHAAVIACVNRLVESFPASTELHNGYGALAIPPYWLAEHAPTSRDMRRYAALLEEARGARTPSRPASPSHPSQGASEEAASRGSEKEDEGEHPASPSRVIVAVEPRLEEWVRLGGTLGNVERIFDLQLPAVSFSPPSAVYAVEELVGKGAHGAVFKCTRYRKAPKKEEKPAGSTFLSAFAKRSATSADGSQRKDQGGKGEKKAGEKDDKEGETANDESEAGQEEREEDDEDVEEDEVALKVIDLDSALQLQGSCDREARMHLLEQIIREGEVLMRCNHPGIVKMYEAFQWPPCYLVFSMELLPGGSLRDLYVSAGPLPEPIIAALMQDVLKALDYLHNGGEGALLDKEEPRPEEKDDGAGAPEADSAPPPRRPQRVHRDLKASNILISAEGRAKLIDFGVCANLSDYPDSRCEEFVGTPQWMAPELARLGLQAPGGAGRKRLDAAIAETGCELVSAAGSAMQDSSKTQRKVSNGTNAAEGYDSRVDLWALGITAYEAAVGSLPWPRRMRLEDLLRTILEGSPPRINLNEGYDKTFCFFVEKCLRKNSIERGTAAELLDHPFFKKFCGSRASRPATHQELKEAVEVANGKRKANVLSNLLKFIPFFRKPQPANAHKNGTRASRLSRFKIGLKAVHGSQSMDPAKLEAELGAANITCSPTTTAHDPACLDVFTHQPRILSGSQHGSLRTNSGSLLSPSPFGDRAALSVYSQSLDEGLLAGGGQPGAPLQSVSLDEALRLARSDEFFPPRSPSLGAAFLGGGDGTLDPRAPAAYSDSSSEQRSDLPASPPSPCSRVGFRGDAAPEPARAQEAQGARGRGMLAESSLRAAVAAAAPGALEEKLAGSDETAEREERPRGESLDSASTPNLSFSLPSSHASFHRDGDLPEGEGDEAEHAALEANAPAAAAPAGNWGVGEVAGDAPGAGQPIASDVAPSQDAREEGHALRRPGSPDDECSSKSGSAAQIRGECDAEGAGERSGSPGGVPRSAGGGGGVGQESGENGGEEAASGLPGKEAEGIGRLENASREKAPEGDNPTAKGGFLTSLFGAGLGIFTKKPTAAERKTEEEGEDGGEEAKRASSASEPLMSSSFAGAALLVSQAAEQNPLEAARAVSDPTGARTASTAAPSASASAFALSSCSDLGVVSAAASGAPAGPPLGRAATFACGAPAEVQVIACEPAESGSARMALQQVFLMRTVGGAEGGDKSGAASSASLSVSPQPAPVVHEGAQTGSPGPAPAASLSLSAAGAAPCAETLGLATRPGGSRGGPVLRRRCRKGAERRPSLFEREKGKTVTRYVNAGLDSEGGGDAKKSTEPGNFLRLFQRAGRQAASAALAETGLEETGAAAAASEPALSSAPASSASLFSRATKSALRRGASLSSEATECRVSSSSSSASVGREALSSSATAFLNQLFGGRLGGGQYPGRQDSRNSESLVTGGSAASLFTEESPVGEEGESQTEEETEEETPWPEVLQPHEGDDTPPEAEAESLLVSSLERAPSRLSSEEDATSSLGLAPRERRRSSWLVPAAVQPEGERQERGGVSEPRARDDGAPGEGDPAAVRASQGAAAAGEETAVGRRSAAAPEGEQEERGLAEEVVASADESASPLAWLWQFRRPAAGASVQALQVQAACSASALAAPSSSSSSLGGSGAPCNFSARLETPTIPSQAPGVTSLLSAKREEAAAADLVQSGEGGHADEGRLAGAEQTRDAEGAPLQKRANAASAWFSFGGGGDKTALEAKAKGHSESGRDDQETPPEPNGAGGSNDADAGESVAAEASAAADGVEEAQRKENSASAPAVKRGWTATWYETLIDSLRRGASLSASPKKEQTAASSLAEGAAHAEGQDAQEGEERRGNDAGCAGEDAGGAGEAPRVVRPPEARRAGPQHAASPSVGALSSVSTSPSLVAAAQALPLGKSHAAAGSAQMWDSEGERQEAAAQGGRAQQDASVSPAPPPPSLHSCASFAAPTGVRQRGQDAALHGDRRQALFYPPPVVPAGCHAEVPHGLQGRQNSGGVFVQDSQSVYPHLASGAVSSCSAAGPMRPPGAWLLPPGEGESPLPGGDRGSAAAAREAAPQGVLVYYDGQPTIIFPPFWQANASLAPGASERRSSAGLAGAEAEDLEGGAAGAGGARQDPSPREAGTQEYSELVLAGGEVAGGRVSAATQDRGEGERVLDDAGFARFAQAAYVRRLQRQSQTQAQERHSQTEAALQQKQALLNMHSSHPSGDRPVSPRCGEPARTPPPASTAKCTPSVSSPRPSSAARKRGPRRYGNSLQEPLPSASSRAETPAQAGRRRSFSGMQEYVRKQRAFVARLGNKAPPLPASHAGAEALDRQRTSGASASPLPARDPTSPARQQVFFGGAPLTGLSGVHTPGGPGGSVSSRMVCTPRSGRTQHPDAYVAAQGGLGDRRRGTSASDGFLTPTPTKERPRGTGREGVRRAAIAGGAHAVQGAVPLPPMAGWTAGMYIDASGVLRPACSAPAGSGSFGLHSAESSPRQGAGAPSGQAPFYFAPWTSAGSGGAARTTVGVRETEPPKRDGDRARHFLPAGDAHAASAAFKKAPLGCHSGARTEPPLPSASYGPAGIGTRQAPAGGRRKDPHSVSPGAEGLSLP